MKKFAFLPLLFALAACNPTPEERVAEAEAALARNDFQSARIHLSAALKQLPGDERVMALQLRTLLALGDGYGVQGLLASMLGDAPPRGQFAEMAAEAALLRESPESVAELLGDLATPEAQRLRALAALMQEDYSAAERHFEAAIAAGGNSRAFSDFARLRLLQGDRAEASRLLTEANRRDPGDIDTLLVGGQLANQSGDLSAALDRYTRAVQLYPGNLAAQIGRAAVLGDLGQLDEMEAAIDGARVRAPDDPRVIYLQARLAKARGNWSELRNIVQERETTIEQMDPIRLLYAEALIQLDLAELASAQVTPFLRSQPHSREVARLFAEARLASGDARGALEAYRNIADNALARPQELALMARIARQAGSAEDAAAYAQRARTDAGRSIGADLAEADAAMRGTDWARAAIAYQRIMDVTDGSNLLVLNNLAYAQLMLGRSSEAQVNARRALALAPNNASVLDTAGLILLRSGNRAEGLRLLRRAAEKAPDNPSIRLHLAEAEGRAS